MALHWLRASTAERKGVNLASLTALLNRLRSSRVGRTASTVCPILRMPEAWKSAYPDADSKSR